MWETANEFLMTITLTDVQKWPKSQICQSTTSKAGAHCRSRQAAGPVGVGVKED